MTTVVLHMITMLTSLYGLTLCALWVKHNSGRELYAVPPALWLAHSAMFSAYVVAYRLIGGAWFDPLVVNVWSMVLRLHIGFTVVGVLTIALKERFDGTRPDHSGDCLNRSDSDYIVRAIRSYAPEEEGAISN